MRRLQPERNTRGAAPALGSRRKHLCAPGGELSAQEGHDRRMLLSEVVLFSRILNEVEEGVVPDGFLALSFSGRDVLPSSASSRPLPRRSREAHERSGAFQKPSGVAQVGLPVFQIPPLTFQEARQAFQVFPCAFQPAGTVFQISAGVFRSSIG